MSIYQELISTFEDEQRTVVFNGLSNYLHLDLFTDVTLICGLRQLRAHKVVLASSCKFFRDLFSRTNNAINAVDLNKELSANGLTLTFEDVQQIVGVLYCVGTVEISPQRIESLLVVAQVLGMQMIDNSYMFTGRGEGAPTQESFA